MSVSDGTYRVSLQGKMTMTNPGGDEIFLLPDGLGDGQSTWQIRASDDDLCTIGTSDGDKYAGWEGDPDPFEPIRLYPQPTKWRILDRGDGTFAIGTPNMQLTLGLSPLMIFPPRVALSPGYGRDGGWTLNAV